jgi:hypothetical protein
MDPASRLNWGWKTRRQTASWLRMMLSKALSPTITASSPCGSPAVNGGWSSVNEEGKCGYPADFCDSRRRRQQDDESGGFHSLEFYPVVRDAVVRQASHHGSWQGRSCQAALCGCGPLGQAEPVS